MSCQVLMRSKHPHYTVLYCTALYCTALHCTALHCTSPYCTAVRCTALRCTLLHRCALHCTSMYCTTMNPSMNQMTRYLEFKYLFLYSLLLTSSSSLISSFNTDPMQGVPYHAHAVLRGRMLHVLQTYILLFDSAYIETVCEVIPRSFMRRMKDLNLLYCSQFQLCDEKLLHLAYTLYHTMRFNDNNFLRFQACVLCMHPTQPLALRLQAARSLTHILVQVEILTFTTPAILTSLEGPADAPFSSRGNNCRFYY
jgi:hypothetical protein